MTPRHVSPRSNPKPQSKVILSDQEIEAKHAAEVARLPSNASAARAQELKAERGALIAKRETAQAQYDGLLDKRGKPRKPKAKSVQAFADYLARVKAHKPTELKP